MPLGEAYLTDIRRTFRNYRALGDAALSQTPDQHLHTELDPNSNSVAVIAKHVGGNLRSRFRDFLTADGEKPDRNRDAEFELTRPPSRAQVLAWWESGWSVLTESLDALTAPDLTRTITIRHESFLVVEALDRSAAHTAYHVGQMVYLARHFAGDQWKTLSIPKGQSARFSKGGFKQGEVERLARGSQTTTDSGAVVRRLYAAFASGDLSSALVELDSAVEWREAENTPYAAGNPFVGRDAVLQGIFARLGVEWTRFVAVPQEFVARGDSVIVLGRYGGTFNANGRSIDARFAHVWRLKNGKITAFEELTDSAQFAAVMKI